MRNVPLALLASAVVLGTASAGLTTLLLQSPSEPESPREESVTAARPGAPADTEAIARIERRVEELTLENSTLVARLAALELRPVAETRDPARGYVSMEEFEELRNELRKSTARTNAAPTEPIAFKEQVAGALTEIRKNEAVEKVETYYEERSARLDEDVAKISDWLELSPYQEDEMRTALAAQYAREAEVARLWKTGEVEDEVLGEMKRADGEAFQADLARNLSPDQLETFWIRVAGGGKDDDERR